MSISTLSKTENRKKLLAFHADALSSVTNPYFLAKMFFRVAGGENSVAFFESEISRGCDIYLEDCAADDSPRDPDRTLYKWRYNSHFEEEYTKSEPAASGICRYFIPVEELVVIRKYEQPKKISTTNIEPVLDLPDPNTDLPLDQLTIRDVAALLLQKPVSNKIWLNEIINDK